MGTISIVNATYSAVAVGGHPIPRPPGAPGPREVHFLGPRRPSRSIMCLFGPKSRTAAGSRLAQAQVTGWMRGLLCRSCNAALGFLRDDPRVATATGCLSEGGRAGRAAPEL